MKEEFLHFIWRFQLFDHTVLKTTEGANIQIIKPGILNTDAGPDFANAKLLISELTWAGSVEVHVKSSDWDRHAHSSDSNYENVILHLVWEDDNPVRRADGQKIPTLELKNLISDQLLLKYKQLMLNEGGIPCESLFENIDELKKMMTVESMAIKRMERKAKDVLSIYAKTVNDWDETAYRLLLKYLGFKLNNAAFETLAERVPFKLARKYATNVFQLEALYFGVSGLLHEENKDLDEYTEKLYKEFNYLKAKHQLEEHIMNPTSWKFMRTRPANFPTIRLAQLVSFVAQSRPLFSAFTEIENLSELLDIFKLEPSAYWTEHYVFGKKTEKKGGAIGQNSQLTLIVNVVVPILIAYGQSIDNQTYKDRAIRFIEEIPAEKNSIISYWKSLGLKAKTMLDSQGEIELYNEFCNKKACLQCGIGLSIIKS